MVDVLKRKNLNNVLNYIYNYRIVPLSPAIFITLKKENEPAYNILSVMGVANLKFN
jgi:hypothetical protein